MVGIEALAAVLAALEAVVDLLGTRLAAADLGLGPLRTGLRIDDQAVGFRQCLLQLALLGAAFTEHLLQLRHAEVGVALGDGERLALLEFAQLALAVGGFLRRVGQLLLERGQLAFVVFLAGQQAQGLFEHLLQGLLLGFGQFALGDLVEAVLNAGGGRSLGRGGREREGQAQPEQGCAKVHTQGHRQTTLWIGAESEFRGTILVRVAFLRGI
ncbi:hypothetical protein D3C81_1126380 [compost metagenome]